MADTINPNSFSTENIVFGASKLTPNGGKSIPLSYKLENKTSNVLFQTPRMLSFGINSWQDPKNPKLEPVYTITMSFIGMEHNQKLIDFYKVMNCIDNWALDVASKNSWDWLSHKTLTPENIKSNYTPCIKLPLEEKASPPSIKIKIKAKDSGFQTTFFDKDKNVIPGSDINKVFNIGSHVRAMIQCTGFWTNSGRFGLSWKILQMIVEPRITNSINFNEYAFEDDE